MSAYFYNVVKLHRQNLYNIALKELKAKELNDKKVEALVAFLKLLTDKKYEYLLTK